MKLIWMLILVVIFICLLLGTFINGQAASNDIPWRDFQLYENQALLVACKAEVMSIIPQTSTSVLLICGEPGPKLSK